MGARVELPSPGSGERGEHFVDRAVVQQDRLHLVIEWHRIKDFQMVSIKQLAEQLLLGCPEQAPGPIALYIPQEVPRQRMAFRKRVVLYASEHNRGARAVAEDLARVMGGAVLVTSEPATIKPAAASCFPE